MIVTAVASAIGAFPSPRLASVAVDDEETFEAETELDSAGRVSCLAPASAFAAGSSSSWDAEDSATAAEGFVGVAAWSKPVYFGFPEFPVASACKIDHTTPNWGGGNVSR